MRLLTGTLFAMLLFGLTACEKPSILLNQPNEDVRSLGGFISNNYDYSLFAAALAYTGLLDTLNNPGEFTVLAPNNTAFNELGISSPDDFQHMNRDSLRYVMAYHILPYALLEANIPEGIVDLRYETLAGERLYASRVISVFEGNYVYRTVGSTRTATDHAVTFSGADAITTDRIMSNGVMHSLAKLMKPFPGVTVQSWLAARQQYSTFVAGLKKFGLWDELAGEGPFTIFATQNDVYLSQGITAEFIANMDTSQYIGARLFGANIMYKKWYFTLDNDFYLHLQRQWWYVDAVKGDSTYKQIFFGSEKASSFYSTTDLQNFTRTSYSLGISPSVAGGNYLGSGSSTPSGSSYYPYCVGFYRALNDNLCTNGLVHDLQGVLVLPDQARSSDDF
ncbi:Uncaracterized surface protein containing fasciclin (FAS1) repeats [bacterium A37T11]|nr:Uncaracterized surface protein containing fasciclin (FAS1) repeats [bacterium A37T11]